MRLEAVDTWLRNLLWESKLGNTHIPEMEMLRVKMLLNDETHSQKIIFQAVRELYDKQEGSKWTEPTSERLNKLVFIGRGLERESLMTSFMDLCMILRN